MAQRQLIRRMIGASFSRAEDALAWAASRAVDAFVLLGAVRAEGPGKVRELARHPVRAIRSVVGPLPAARRRTRRREAPAEEVQPVAPPPVERAERAKLEHLPEPTDPEFRLESGHARVTTTSRGRKTVPISVAAARKARAQVEPKPGLRPKHGQKKRH